MQPTGISSGLLRVLAQHAPDLLSEMLTPGKVLDAEVVSTHGDKAMLNLGRNLRIEVTLQASLADGQKVKLQVQPREQGAQPGDGRAPILLKVVSEQAQGERLLFTPGAAQAQQAAGLQLQAGAASLPEAVPQPQTQPGQTQPSQPQVAWLPIPLPQGGQAWAQVYVQEESPRKGRASSGPIHQVRIFWETPGLGPVQVTMDAAATALSALFTTALAESRTSLEQHLPDLQQRLLVAGFTEARLGARQQRLGETIEPAKADEASRLNRRV